MIRTLLGPYRMAHIHGHRVHSCWTQGNPRGLGRAMIVLSAHIRILKQGHEAHWGLTAAKRRVFWPHRTPLSARREMITLFPSALSRAVLGGRPCFMLLERCSSVLPGETPITASSMPQTQCSLCHWMGTWSGMCCALWAIKFHTRHVWGGAGWGGAGWGGVGQGEVR
jgi:hypothetical protein